MQPVSTQYIYHWNRIFGALALLLLLIGLIGFGLHAWLSSPSTSADAEVDAVDAPVALVEGDPGSDDQDAAETTPELPEAEGTPIPDTVASTDAVVPVEESREVEPETGEAGNEVRSRVFLPPDTRVNLRAAPSLSSPVLRILDVRDELQLLESGAAFFQVRSADGIVGWVSRDYSSLEPYPAPASD